MLKVMHKYTDTLVEVMLIYVVCLLLAAWSFACIEHKPFLDSLYWAGITATSTGYGDITPKTMPGMVLAFFLTHLSIFVVAPMIIVRLSQKLIQDENEFTHQEQEEIKELLTEIKDKLK